ncbi:MAG: hypothetical protein ABH828_00830 [archaeon]
MVEQGGIEKKIKDRETEIISGGIENKIKDRKPTKEENTIQQKDNMETKPKKITKPTILSEDKIKEAEELYNKGIKELNKKYFGLQNVAWDYFEKAINIDESYMNKVKKTTDSFGRTKKERKNRQLFFFMGTQRYPKDDYWYMILGDSFRLQGDWATTIKVFDEALAINPSARYHNGKSLRQVRDSFNQKNDDGAGMRAVKEETERRLRELKYKR